ncbi:riboflavin kinase [Blastococcus sp. SYSU D00695]
MRAWRARETNPRAQEDRWDVSGLVVRGEQRGRLLGYPTANLQLVPPVTLPGDGVYAGVAEALDGPVLRRVAAISVGTNPTFDGPERTLEAHLLDFEGDLYGRRLRVRSVRRLRGMVRFPDVEALVAAIERDVLDTRAVFGDVAPLAGGARPGPALTTGVDLP